MRRLLPLLLPLAVTACAPERFAGAPGTQMRPAQASTAPQRAPAYVPPPKPVPEKPTWVARRVVADGRDIQASQVIAGPKDTLAQIARRTGTSLGVLAVANGLGPPYTLYAGQRINIPAGRYHVVKEGETGIAIARAYGADWESIISANRLQPPYTLRVGQILRMPTRAAVAAMTLEERASAFRIDIDDLISGGEPAAAAPPPARNSQANAAKTATPAKPQPPLQALPVPPAFSGRFIWPVNGNLLSDFGAKEGGRYNDGINIAADKGTPFAAAADGIVAYAGDAIEGFGNLILIKHGEDWVTAYAHADELLVTRGQRVKRGDIIGRVGNTGSVSEPQLHFEVRRGRTPVNPVQQLPAHGHD